MRPSFVALAMAVLVGCVRGGAAVRDAHPLDAYEEVRVAGFTVKISKSLSQHPDERRRVLALLASRLAEAATLIDSTGTTHAPALLRVTFWVEWAARSDRALEFHNSAAWLRAHGYLAEKEKSIEVANTNNFLTWSADQPMLVMHELAHALLDMTTDEERDEVRRAYEHAQALHLYDAVPDVHGRTVKAYAAVNPIEYFGELSEAYFGKNDFYPFDRAQLRAADPEGFAAIESVWAE